MSLKRIVAAAFVSAITVVGIAPAADAVPSDRSSKIATIRPGVIDWDSPSPTAGSGGATTQRIDWD